MASSEMSSSDDHPYPPEGSSSSRKKCEDADEFSFSQDEEDLILRMYKLVGERWSLIAGRIPGRSAEQIKKFYTARFCKKTETTD